jgi:short-subunit dehydrogenase
VGDGHDVEGGAAAFADRYGPWAVVAGASEGIGASVARLLGERGVRVVLVARRQEALDEVAGAVATDTRTVVLDLSVAGADAALAEATADLDVGLVVYNAGADPHHSTFLDKPLEVWQELVRRNCDTVLGVAHRFGARLVERGRGGLVLVTSGAAWVGGSHLAAYSASKAFDLTLGESLWAELGPRGVDVLSMVLGATDTPALRRVLGDREMEGLADADDVARDMLDHLGDGPTFPGDPTPFSGLPRRQAVELMSSAASFLADE